MDLWNCVRQNAPQTLQELLINGEVDVNERNDFGETALHLAAKYGYVEVMQILLTLGANANLQDWESEWTALHRSIYYKQWKCALLLLRHAQHMDGRDGIQESLYMIRDASQQSVMELMSSPCLNERTKRGGMVYTFGKVDFQLGYHLSHVLIQSTPRVVPLPCTHSIVQISASKFHTVIVNDCGMVYVWGFGKGGRLGIGTEYDCIEPVLMTSLQEIPIIKVAAGENHTLALSASGQVFSWGSNRFGQLGHVLKTTTLRTRCLPKRMERFRGIKMTHIAASTSHSAAIGEEHGKVVVYTWGSNKRGQLGRREGFQTDQAFPIPTSVDRLSSEFSQAIDVAMSDFHTCVLLRVQKNGLQQGQVWQFGGGSHVPNRILFPTTGTTSQQIHDDFVWQPRWRREYEINDIIAVSCARNHSIALSSTGAVFTWGHNGDALSHDQQTTLTSIPGTPQRVVALDAYARVVSICAAQNHCAVVTCDGDVVTWGCGSLGVLGHGSDTSWQPQPKRVEGAKKVIAVAAGHQHTVLLVAPEIPSYPPTSIDNLQTLVQERIAAWIDLTNVAVVWKYATSYDQSRLEQFCMEYMVKNGDALLEMGSRDRLDMLFDLVLPPMERSIKSISIAKETAMVCPLSVPPIEKSRSESSASLANEEVDSKESTDVIPSETSRTMELPPAPLTIRKKSHTKFIPLEMFLADKHKETKTLKAVSDTPIAQWTTVPSIPVDSPFPLSSAGNAPKKKVMMSSGANVMPRDRSTGSTFSLDAFIVTKKSQRKKSRGESNDQSMVKPSTPWVSSAPTKARTLKEIQEEEEARAQAQVAAKAKHGGYVCKMSTMNSWGHVETPVCESLAELQKRQEEEAMIEEQRQILAQIQLEREQRGAEKDRKKVKKKKENVTKKGKENRMQQESTTKRGERKFKPSKNKQWVGV